MARRPGCRSNKGGGSNILWSPCRPEWTATEPNESVW
jgi:hypothetical protein